MREAVIIGKQIRKYRRGKDITQEELAEKIGVSLAWIGRVERGSVLPTVKLLIQIAQVLRVKVYELIPF
jgi:transcriptional regulator with XRE-family HTH domain